MVLGAVQFGPVRSHLALDVMAGGHAVRFQVLGGFQQVLELHPLVAADAGHRGGAGQVAVGEFVDHRVLEDVFVIQNVMGETHFLGHPAGVVDVNASAAGALLGQRRAVIVKLQRDPHHVIAFLGQLRGDDGTVDAAGHGDDHPRFRRGFGKAKRIQICPVVQHAGGSFESLREYRKIADTLKGCFHFPLNPQRKTAMHHL